MAPATLGYLTELSPILVIKITWLKRCNFPFNRVTVHLEKLLNGITNAVNLLSMAAANVTSLLELCTLNKKEESYISHSSILC